MIRETQGQLMHKREVRNPMQRRFRCVEAEILEDATAVFL
jgi:hypothetical protein